MAGSTGGQIENVQDDQGANSFEYGGIYKSTDAGETWKRLNSLNPRPMYFSLLRVDPMDDKYLYVGGVSMYRSTDSGKTFRADAGRGVHADQHALWVDPKDGRHMLVGCDGGFYVTYDRTRNWDQLNTVAIGQFYHVSIAPTKPYRVAGGLQDNGSWMGPAISLNGSGPINEDYGSMWVGATGSSARSIRMTLTWSIPRARTARCRDGIFAPVSGAGFDRWRAGARRRRPGADGEDAAGRVEEAVAAAPLPVGEAEGLAAAGGAGEGTALTGIRPLSFRISIHTSSMRRAIMCSARFHAVTTFRLPRRKSLLPSTGVGLLWRNRRAIPMWCMRVRTMARCG